MPPPRLTTSRGRMRLLEAASVLSALGDMLALTALLLRVHDSSRGGGLGVTVVTLAVSLPYLLAAPGAGALLDGAGCWSARPGPAPPCSSTLSPSPGSPQHWRSSVSTRGLAPRPDGRRERLRPGGTGRRDPAPGARPGAAAGHAALLAVGGVVLGTGVVLCALSPDLGLAALPLAAGGAGNALQNVGWSGLQRLRTPEPLRGRTFAAGSAILQTAIGLSTVLGGVLVNVLGSRGALLATGGAGLAVAVVVGPRARQAAGTGSHCHA